MLTVELRSADASVPLLSLDGDPQTVTDLVAGVADGPAIHSTFTDRIHTTLGTGRGLDDPEESEAVRDILTGTLAAAGTVTAFNPLYVRTDAEQPSTTFDRLTVWDDDIATDFPLGMTLTAAGTSEGAYKAWQSRRRGGGPHHGGFVDVPHTGEGRLTEAQAQAARDEIAKDLAKHPERDDGRADVLGGLESNGAAATIARYDRLKGKDKWTRERRDLHDAIIARRLAEASDVPNDHQAVLLGGMSGSGKSTLTTHPDLGLDPTKYMYIDPDAIKQDLLDTPGAVPRVKGMSEGEHAALIHKESSHIVDQMIVEAMRSGKNVIIDKTMSEDQHDELTELKDSGYTVRGVFADITVDEAVKSADVRWRVKDGRFVPEPYIRASETPEARSKNLLFFQDIMPRFEDWTIVDQDGISEGHPKGTMKRGKGTGEFAAGVMVFRSIDYEEVIGRPHPGTVLEQADAVAAGERVSVDGPAGLALLHELGNRTESSDLTLVTIDGRPNTFAKVANNQLRRVDMPQIPPDHLDAFAAHLRKVGVGVRETSLDPLELRATQNELDGRKTGQMIRAMEHGSMVAPPVWVSADGFVLDGTHRWAAEAVLAGAEPRRMKVCQAAAPISILLPMARAFADDAGIDSKAHGMTLRPFAFAGNSEGARKAWESRKKGLKSPPAATAPVAPPAPPTPPPPTPPTGPGNGLPTADEFDAMEHIGGPLGSQGGGWYRDSSGQRYLVKPGQSKTQAHNELAAHLLYKQAGVATDDTGVFERNGKWYIAKKAVQGVDGKLGKQVGNGNMTPDMQAQARNGYAVDALASSWDVFGMHGDNVIMEGGTLHRVDVGGSMMYRAVGGNKSSFNPGKEWVEPSTMRSHRQGKELYGKMTNSEAAQQLAKLQQFDVDAYDRTLERAGVDSKVRARVVATIRDRIDNQLPKILHHLDPNLTAAGTSEGATRAWQSRRRGTEASSAMVRGEHQVHQYDTAEEAGRAQLAAILAFDAYTDPTEQEDQWTAFGDSLDADQKAAWENYGGNGYHEMNDCMRRGTDCTPEVKAMNAAFEQAIRDHGVTAPPQLFRGKTQYTDDDLGYQIGDEITDKGFGSWSSDTEFPRIFAAVADEPPTPTSVFYRMVDSKGITVAPGANSIQWAGATSENEMTTPPGTRYKVVAITDYNAEAVRNRIIDVEVLT